MSKHTDTERFLDALRDVFATALKVTADRDGLIQAKHAADAEIERLEEECVDLANEIEATYDGLNQEAMGREENTAEDVLRQIIADADWAIRVSHLPCEDGVIGGCELCLWITRSPVRSIAKAARG